MGREREESAFVGERETVGREVREYVKEYDIFMIMMCNVGCVVGWSCLSWLIKDWQDVLNCWLYLLL